MRRTLVFILAAFLAVAPIFGQSLTFTDARNKSFTLPAKAARIVSLSPAMTEIIYTAGAGNTLVGNTSWCNYPAEAVNVAKVGGYSAQSISVETIVALKPDLVFGELGSSTDLAAAMDNAGLRFVAVNLKNFEDIFKAIELVGRTAGDLAKANSTVADLRARLAVVAGKIAGIPVAARQRIFYEIWHEPLMTAGPNTFISQIIVAGGGINIFDDVDTDWPTVSFESIIVRNPDYIMASDTHGENITNDKLVLRPGWASLRAVQQNRIALFDGDIISRPGPRFVDAVEMVAKRLNPRLF